MGRGRNQGIPSIFSSDLHLLLLTWDQISDKGGGIPREDLARMFDYYYTTIPQEAPTYTYSGGFGAPLMGLGCGLPLARLYAKYMDGDIAIASLPGTDRLTHPVCIF